MGLPPLAYIINYSRKRAMTGARGGNMKLLIVFTGHARAGKDTAADFMEKEVRAKGYSCYRTAFAKALKDCAYKCGWDGVKDEKGRTLLQHLGDVMREYHGKDCFSKLAYDAYMESGRDIGIITDCRFLNEEKYIWGRCYQDGVILWFVKITGNHPESKTECLTPAQLQHHSESEIDEIDYDFLIKNDGTMDDLKAKVHETAEHIF